MISRRSLLRTAGMGIGALAGCRLIGPTPAAAQRVARLQSAPIPPLTQILGRPTARSIALSVATTADTEAFVEYGRAVGGYAEQTAPVRIAAGKPTEIEIGGLAPDVGYRYRLRTRPVGAATFAEGEAAGFQTARAAGSSFTFTVQGDSHPERLNRMFDPGLYAQTMGAIAAEAPDFHVTIGDDFSLDPLINAGTLSQATVDAIYSNQRTFLGEIGRSAPIFLTNGNHEAVEMSLRDGTATCAPVLAGRARLSHFALPAPDGFYSGDREAVPFVGMPRDYYAWTWGDALFVVFDPYWHSPAVVDPVERVGGGGGNRNRAGGGRGAAGGGGGAGGRARDWWGMSIGDAQYQWLKATLEGSNARYKFVFSHHILGTGRGGIEMAEQYEWGGRGANGGREFERYRPGWAMPIHQLLAETGVSVFFFGHDHLFARQEKDGVIYQETPMPADPTYTAFNADAYRSGDILPNTGYLRVKVTPAAARVEYVASVLAKDETAARRNGAIAFAYDVKPRAAP